MNNLTVQRNVESLVMIRDSVPEECYDALLALAKKGRDVYAYGAEQPAERRNMWIEDQRYSVPEMVLLWMHHDLDDGRPLVIGHQQFVAWLHRCPHQQITDAAVRYLNNKQLSLWPNRAYVSTFDETCTTWLPLSKGEQRLIALTQGQHDIVEIVALA